MIREETRQKIVSIIERVASEEILPDQKQKEMKSRQIIFRNKSGNAYIKIDFENLPNLLITYDNYSPETLGARSIAYAMANALNSEVGWLEIYIDRTLIF